MTSLPSKTILQPKRNSPRRAEPPCQAHLAEADKISPGNAYTDFVRYLNKAGCDSLDYATDRDDVEAKLNKYYKR